MPPPGLAVRMLEQEARALLTRLDRVKPFALHETMVPAAALSPVSQTAIESFLTGGRRQLRADVERYLRWLRGPGSQAPASELQRRFAVVRLRFNDVLSQFDLFQEAITQRSEHEIGVWLSGLDVAAADALRIPGGDPEVPPVVCYLDRGAGAAIRRARTRLPGGGPNPVALVRVPRERMIGTGIAASLVHEVGHQAAALLGLVEELRPLLQRVAARKRRHEQVLWQLWERWVSEIVADLWAVSRLGIGGTLGLIGVVSLPPWAVFRLSVDDPHPFPWIRVRLSCAMGHALNPDPQWERLADLWGSLYPLTDRQPAERTLISGLEATMQAFISLLLHHPPRSLRGRSLVDVMPRPSRQPTRLREVFASWRAVPSLMQRAPPTLAFAALGQARVDGQLSPEEESRILGGLLTRWALESTLEVSAACAIGTAPTPARTLAPATTE